MIGLLKDPWRHGSGVQGRGYFPGTACRPEVPFRRGLPRSSNAGAASVARRVLPRHWTIPTSAPFTRLMRKTDRLSSSWSS